VLFNSLHFVAFFPLVVAAYFATPPRHRWALLLAASYYFYGSWHPQYLVLLVASTGVDYFAALRMGSATGPARRAWLLASLVSNLGLLGYFKYAGFVTESVRGVLTPMGIVLGDTPGFHPLLPVGISFYTFQTLAYSIDVYRGDVPPQRHLGKFALYVSFFPQLVAGPIERAKTLLPQFDRVNHLVGGRVVSGLTRMAWGFFQKLVIADRLAVYVNDVYGGTGPETAASVLLASYFFYFQIYADFSGYTDIAIGAARVLGYDLSENFNRAYLATSTSDFWRRWHITLLTWFRDYLFRPLGWSRPGRLKWARNTMIVFVASGLWHGAAWTFVAFGAVCGILIIAGETTRRRRDRAWAAVGRSADRVRPGAARLLEHGRPWLARIAVFHMMTCALVLFRSPSIGRALELYASFFGGLNTLFGFPGLPLPKYELALAVLAVATFLAVDMAVRGLSLGPWFSAQPRWVRWSAFYAVSLATLALGEFSTVEFYYFQF
jgi:alginate O-acetyltransferase complex protein AlgI